MNNDFPKYFEIPTQVRFLESLDVVDDPQWIDGIAFQDFVICGECGSIIPFEDIQDLKDYSNWNSISEEILGDDSSLNFSKTE